MAASQGQSYYKISVAFEKSFDAPILPGLATTGRFLLPSSDPAVLSAAKAPALAPCLAAATTGQRVILHNNNANTAAAKRSAKHGETGSVGAGGSAPLGGDEAALRTFSFGKEPTAIGAGPLNKGASVVPLLQQQEALLYGAATSLLAYDVDQNRQYFYKDVEDGVRAVVSGEVDIAGGGGGGGDAAGPPPVLVLVGGNCSIYGFDSHGAERLWTVTGDQVTAMMMLPWGTPGGPAANKGDPAPALVSASEDYEIRVFRGEEAIASIMEVDCARQLVPLYRRSDPSSPSSSAAASAGRFAYLLHNGTVGVYQHTERLWRIKSKCLPVSAAFSDLDCDGVAELVVGYDNGRIEVRSDLRAGDGSKGGEVLFRDTYSAPVAAVLAEDYRQDGRVLPLVCTVDGNVRGLTLLESNLEDAEEARDARVLEDLTRQRALLASQLASLEEQLALQRKGEQDLTMPEAGLEVRCALRANFASQKLDIVFTLANAPRDAVIHSCVLRATAAAGFFSAPDDASSSPPGADGQGLSGDSRCYFNEEPSDTLVCPTDLARDVGGDLAASVAVGGAFAESYQVHELTVAVPPFVAYQLPTVAQEQYPNIPLAYRTPHGFVRFTFDRPLRMEAVESWMRRAFNVPSNHPLADSSDPNGPALHLKVLSIRDGGSPLAVDVVSSGGGGPAKGTSTVTVYGDTMDVCGDVVASLDAVAGGVAEEGAAPTETLCEFPEELQRLQGVLASVDALNEVRLKLSTDMADAAAVVKTLLVRAEDARLLGDMQAMRKGYAALYDVNKELLGENMKRAGNYEELKKALKEVNVSIQAVGRLRLGSAQRSAVVTACRNALKGSNTTALMDIVRTGSAT